MNEGIADIELGLENFETVRISRDKIGNIVIKDFREDFRRRAINSISLMKIADYVILQIKDAQQIFEEDIVEEETKTLLDVLNYNNITNIKVNFKDEEKYYSWFVDWEEDETYIYQNSLQTTKEVFGDVWVAIGEKAQEELGHYLPESQNERDNAWEFME